MKKILQRTGLVITIFTLVILIFVLPQFNKEEPSNETTTETTTETITESTTLYWDNNNEINPPVDPSAPTTSVTDNFTSTNTPEFQYPEDTTHPIDIPATLPLETPEENTNTTTTTYPNYNEEPTSTPENTTNNIITLNNTKIMIDKDKLISVTESTKEMTGDIKKIHNTVFEEIKNDISSVYTIKSVTPLFKTTEEIEGSEAYMLIGFANTVQFGKSYIITTTTVDNNKPYNFTAIYSSDMSLEEIMNSMETDMDLFSNMIV